MIERISNYYTNDKCALLTLPFNKCITVFSSDLSKCDMLCHYDFTDDSQNINKYLDDSRRCLFPYADIPMYKGLLGRFYVNGIFEYNKHYISITDGFIRDRYLVRDGESSIVYNRNIRIPLCTSGNSYSKDELKTLLKNDDYLYAFDKYGRQYFVDGKTYLNFDSFITSGGGLLVLKDTYNIKLVKITRDIGFDNYLYKELNVSLNDYTVEELKYFSSKIKNAKDIYVCSSVNPNIDKKSINENKKKVRKSSK